MYNVYFKNVLYKMYTVPFQKCSVEYFCGVQLLLGGFAFQCARGVGFCTTQLPPPDAQAFVLRLAAFEDYHLPGFKSWPTGIIRKFQVISVSVASPGALNIKHQMYTVHFLMYTVHCFLPGSSGPTLCTDRRHLPSVKTCRLSSLIWRCRCAVSWF